ncbi:SLATT domain-containing protein [Lacticaseibacillus zhaodongensis]|uniref:SLATT domain-containing protein n=1 Tax=Lacticaseibacillus zhaodongensis TaxID=2668065 RepID=UPI0012D35235|nr:SLATT domain-containing protein [Lacticaseibacillus zhaodongensis]
MNSQSTSEHSQSNETSDDKEQALKLSIEKKLSGWDRTRHNRINASERLKSYDEKWSVLMLFMNSVAVVFLFLTFAQSKDDESTKIISACYSAYVLILQYFLGTRDYSARSLKLHYQQLEIESMRSDLKAIMSQTSYAFNEKERLVHELIRRYQISLSGSENHTPLDDARYIQSKEKGPHSKAKDFSLDNVLIYINVIILVGIIFTICRYYIL